MPTIPLTITIKDYKYSANITVPQTEPICTLPQVYNRITGKCETPEPICTLPQVYNRITGKCETPEVSREVRIVKILPESERKLPDANSGETVKITATVVCKTADTISKPRDTAYLIVDGAIADRKTIENGIVIFEWEATAVPTSIHTICVKVEPSTNCRSPGQDCKRITVSPTKLSIAEQLAKERSAASEQKKLLEEARSRLREEIIGAELTVPGAEAIGPYVPPTTEPLPMTPLPITTPPTPEYGDIEIVGLPALLIPISPELPTYVYIDNKNIGRIYELPKTVTNVSVGTHNIYARAGDITSPVKTAIVKKDETTNVTL